MNCRNIILFSCLCIFLFPLGCEDIQNKTSNNIDDDLSSDSQSDDSFETILSRNLKLLSQSQRAQAILVGTISQSQRTMYISARLINPNDSTIISSKNYRLYMDKNVLTMFNLQLSGNGDTIKPPSESKMNTILY